MNYSTIQINLAREKISEFCRHWQIIELSLFGSVLRPDFRPDSDVDILVTFAPHSHYTVFDLITMREELEMLFGRKVDLVEKPVIEKSSNWLRRQEILASALPIFTTQETEKKLTQTPRLNLMSRDLATLLDMARFATTINQIAQDMTRDELETDVIKQSAVLYQIAILGEAVKRLSPEFRSQYSEISWKNIAGMRDILTHKYDQINLDIVWDVMENRIPELLEQVKPLLPTEEILP